MRVVRGPGLDRVLNSAAHGIRAIGESLAVQAEKVNTDINEIMRRFGVTGLVPTMTLPPLEGDHTRCGDFHSAMQLVAKAKEAFMGLDAATRKRFSNDPAEYVKFCSDEKNLPEMRKMGIAIPEKAPPEPVPPMEVRIVDDFPIPEDVRDADANKRGRSRHVKGGAAD